MISYGYDAMGRAIKVTDGESVTFYTYTRTGRLKSVVDALGNETAYTYDVLDNLKSIHRAEGLVSLEESTGEIFPTVGKDGHVTVYDYNLSGQLTGVTDALGQKEHYEYDQYGRLISKTDKDDYKTTYLYNLNNQVNAINYADGRSVALSYDAIGRLEKFNDWLGATEIERDILGRVISVTDYNGKKVSYTYGKTDERTSITYPSGKRVDYIYDDKLNLTELINGNEKTRYTYDELDRLIEKCLPNANREVMDYLPGGFLKSLEMYDNKGLLDKYVYSYDSQGNRTEIDRLRRNLDEISGRYSYRYDQEKRLTSVSLNGELLRSYGYDAFGNRSSMSENGNTTIYSYDELDRLLEETNSIEKKTYSYDKRGNIAEKRINDTLEKTFTYDATNMLTRIEDVSKGDALYSYNGLGKRISVVNPTERIEYLLDLTKDYHNMLERSVNGEVETYTYDSNVVSMSKEGRDYFYMHDELGTGMYLTGTDGMAVASYAYDEFGRNLNPFTGKKEKPSYTKQGNIIQPFAFTGYQHDEMTGSYYAQARYYDAGVGRFVSEDKVRGYVDIPNTINHYLYCNNVPIDLVDLNGREPETAYIYYISGKDGFEKQALWQGRQLEKQGYDVEYIDLTEKSTELEGVVQCDNYNEMGVAATFEYVWNEQMPDDVDTVYIFAHGSERMLQFKDGSLYNALTVDGNNSKGKKVAGKLGDLESKSGVKKLYIQACNTGHIETYYNDSEKNVSQILSEAVPNASTYSWDGSVSFYNLPWNKNARISNRQGHMWDELNNGEKYPGRPPYGQLEYKNGKMVENYSTDFIRNNYEYFIKNGGMYCDGEG